MRLIDHIANLDFPAPLPATLLEIEQRFNADHLPDPGAAARAALESLSIPSGASVAVGVGSRGVRDIVPVTRSVIAYLRDCGAEPFIFPAMGSHGGATADGQRQMLAELGVTEESTGAEIRASMDVVEIGHVEDGPRLFQDANAHAADYTLLINRIKLHTDFHGPLESGLAKMCVIGLGKQYGASMMHAYGGAGFRRYLGPAARVYEANTNLIGGLAIIENAYDQTAHIQWLEASEIGAATEELLLDRARSMMPSLPFPEIDVLVLRQIGKNISGTGMDTNIINRVMIPRQPEPTDGVDVAIITVLDLTRETHGNAAGIGLANITTARVAQQIDWHATYTNAVTSGIFGMFRVSLPITMPDDQRALQVAVRGCAQPAEAARIVFIQDTLHVDRMWVSSSLRQQVEAYPQLTITGEVPLTFDNQGTMTAPWQLD
jgi:hypothetical protein